MRTVIRSGLALTLLAGMPTLLTGQAPEGFRGEWRGRGSFVGTPALAVITWEPILMGQGTRLAVSIRDTTGATPLFEGIAQFGPGLAQGSWIDSRHNLYPLTGVVREATLATSWRREGTEIGRSGYRLLEGGALLLVDSVVTRDGTWREINRFQLCRVGVAPCPP
jgi:hypothetical protein